MFSQRVLRFALMAAMSALILTAQQTGSGTVQGVVRDVSSAVVAGARVTIVNTATMVRLSTAANDVGFFAFPPVQPGFYTITVAATGMDTWEGKFQLPVGQTAEISPVLKVGAVTAQITVAGEVAPLVTTSDATISTNLEHARIEQLPENGRNIANLVLLASPGLVGGQDGAINPIVNGLRDGVEMYQDGAVIKNRDTGDFSGRLPGVDSVEEVRVETSLSSAKSDRPGAVILSTRSGSNGVHGTLFETNRDSAIGVARARTDYYTKPPHFVRNEFGGSVGGPVIVPKLYNGRNRTFFFTTYERLFQESASTFGTEMATSTMRQGDFSGLINSIGQPLTIYDPLTTGATPNYQRTPFPSNQIPVSRESPLAKYLFSVTPAPNYAANPLIGDNYYGLASYTTRDYMSTTRIDHVLSERDRIFGRFSVNRDDYWYPRDVPTLDNTMNTVYNLYLDTNGAASWIHTFSPTFLSETLVTFSREHKITSAPPNGGIPNLASFLGMPNPVGSTWTPFSVSGPGFALAYSVQQPRENFSDILVIDQNFTRIHGRHEILFGGRYHQEYLHSLIDQPSDTVSFSSNFTGLFDPTSGSAYSAVPNTGYSAASLFVGAASGYSEGVVAPAFGLRSPEYAAYIQDNWRASSKLTLNFGLRYEDLPATGTVGNYSISFDPKTDSIVLGRSLQDMYQNKTLNPSAIAQYQAIGMKLETPSQAGYPASLIQGSPWNFEPRAGFAYRIGEAQKPFVLRGGYGIYDAQTALRVWDTGVGGSAPLAYGITYSLDNQGISSDGLPNYSLRTAPQYVAGQNSQHALDNPALVQIAPGSKGVSYINPYQPPSMSQEWNVSLGREILPGIIAKLGYVGTHAIHLPQKYNLNAAPNSYIWYVTTGQPLPTGTYAATATEPYDKTTWGAITDLQKTGYSNYNSLQIEVQRRYSRGYGFQFFYVMSNAFTNSTLVANGGGPTITPASSYLPGAVPQDFNQLNRDLYYTRDTAIPKHQLTWNWVVDLPFGRGKPLGHNVGKFLDEVIGGWQLAGTGSYRSNYWSLPTSNWGPTGPVQVYGKKYPIQDCSGGTCIPGYLYWNGYISPHLINETNAAGQCIGICGVPSSYKPAVTPLIPYGTTALPPNAPAGTNVSSYWDTNTVWVPLKNGTVVRTTYNSNYNPWQNQYFPGPWNFGLNASLFKVFAATERVKFRFNADFFQVLNNPGRLQPGNLLCASTLATCPSGNAAIQYTNASANSPRVLQLGLRMTW